MQPARTIPVLVLAAASIGLAQTPRPPIHRHPHPDPPPQGDPVMLTATDAVSYTHLDVYKRQDMVGAFGF